jgi:hypothetical protein
MTFGDRQEVLAAALQTSSTELSKLARQVGFGLVGFALAMLVSDSSFPKLIATQYRTQLLIISACGTFAVLFDYLQYLCGYFSSHTLLMNERKESSWLAHVVRFFFFIIQIFSVVGAIYLAVLISILLAHHA